MNRGEKDFSLEKILHQPVFVPETVNLDMLFKDMQTDHNHLVIVVNEYGETSGIVSMEDILEEIVGEIWDERDEEVSEFLETGKTLTAFYAPPLLRISLNFSRLRTRRPRLQPLTAGLPRLPARYPKRATALSIKILRLPLQRQTSL